MRAVALNAGPSLCGRPQGPVKAVSFTLNLGSPKPPVDKSPDGLEIVCTFACALMYCWMVCSRSLLPAMKASTRYLAVSAASRVQE